MYLYSSNPDFRSSVSITNCWFGFSRCGSSDTFTNLKFRIYDFFNEYLLWFLFSTCELRKNVCYEPMGSLFLFQLLKLRKIRETNWWNYLIWLFKIQKLVTNCNVQTAHFLRQNRPFYQLKNPKTRQLPHSTLFDCIPNNSQKST